jgi:hypothetical protein
MHDESYPRPAFGPDDLPLSLEQMHARETWQATVGNWRGDHSSPSSGRHYQYLWEWDGRKNIVNNARRGEPDRAMVEFLALERYCDPLTGFRPNKIFATAPRKTWRDYPEAWNFNDNRVGSSYTQPPLAAWAAIETYRSFRSQGREDEGLAFLRRVYGTAEPHSHSGLRGGYAYFIDHRQNGPDDPLIGIVHPNETGRDSDEANKPWLVSGTGRPNAVREWLYMQKLGHELGRLGRDPAGRRIDWIPEQTRQKYWVNDVMFNAMYAHNIWYLADIADLLHDSSDDGRARAQYAEDAGTYRGLAADVEKHVLTRMWNRAQGFFFNLDQRGEQIPVTSITGLFPLMLRSISKEQLISLLDKLERADWFATPYPIPSHPACSEFHSPDPAWFEGTFTPPWSGPVWVSMNHHQVEEGLVPRALGYADPQREETYDLGLARRAMAVAGRIAGKTLELLAMNDRTMECYSPTTGKGQRVRDFMWSNLGLHLDNYAAAAVRIGC